MEIDLHRICNNKPKPINFLFCGLTKKTVGNISSPGATGKSFFSLQLAFCAADEEADAELFDICHGSGKVAIYNAEDPVSFSEDDDSGPLDHRLFDIAQSISPEALERAIKNIKLVSLVGDKKDICDSKFMEKVINDCAGYNLIIFDTLTRFHFLNENDNKDMSLVISSFEKIAAQTGAAVLFLHHNSKGAVLNGQQGNQQATRGASAITDNCRWQGYMQVMTEKEAAQYGIKNEHRKQFVKFEGNKENYGRATPPMWLKRGEGGVLTKVELAAGATPIKKEKLKLVNKNIPSFGD